MTEPGDWESEASDSTMLGDSRRGADDDDGPPDNRHAWRWDDSKQQYFYFKYRWNKNKSRWRTHRKWERGRPDPSVRPPVLGAGEPTTSPWDLGRSEEPPCCDSCGEDLSQLGCTCAARVCARDRPGARSFVTGEAVRGRGEVGYLRRWHVVQGFYFDASVDRGVAGPETPDEGRAPSDGDPESRWWAAWRTPLAEDEPARMATGAAPPSGGGGPVSGLLLARFLHLPAGAVLAPASPRAPFACGPGP